jgi:hypothetical protein
MDDNMEKRKGSKRRCGVTDGLLLPELQQQRKKGNSSSSSAVVKIAEAADLTPATQYGLPRIISLGLKSAAGETCGLAFHTACYIQQHGYQKAVGWDNCPKQCEMRSDLPEL